MQPLLGRTVSQIKNRFYQSLKGKDLKKGKQISVSDIVIQKHKSCNKRQEKQALKNIHLQQLNFSEDLPDKHQSCKKMKLTGASLLAQDNSVSTNDSS